MSMLFDPLQTQRDLEGILLSYPALGLINVKSYRKLREAQELDYRLMLSRPRTNKVGGAVLVCEPQARVESPNVTGPILEWEFPVVSFEQHDIAFNPLIGVNMTAEEMSQHVMAAIHLYADDKLGTFRVSNPAIADEKEFVFPGVIGYRTTFYIKGKSIQMPRTQPVAITVDGVPLTSTVCSPGVMEMTCTTAGAVIKYTLDGSFPGADEAGNTGSMPYTAPFAVDTGATVRAIAYGAGLLNSPGRFVQVT